MRQRQQTTSLQTYFGPASSSPSSLHSHFPSSNGLQNNFQWQNSNIILLIVHLVKMIFLPKSILEMAPFNWRGNILLNICSCSVGFNSELNCELYPQSWQRCVFGLLVVSRWSHILYLSVLHIGSSLAARKSAAQFNSGEGGAIKLAKTFAGHSCLWLLCFINLKKNINVL